MATKTTRTAAGRAGASPAASTTARDATAAPGAAGFSIVQGQMQAFIALADVMLKGAEECRRCQFDIAHEARQRHERAQADVASAANPSELLNIQSELLRYDMEAGSRYWQQLGAIVAATQAEAVNLVTRSAATIGGDVARATTSAPVVAASAAAQSSSGGDKGNGLTPELDPSQAWNRWVDLGRQWSDMLYRTEAALH